MDNDLNNEKETNQNKKHFFEIIRFALITLVIVVPIRAYVAQPFVVNGDSMIPSFHNGEYLIIDELSYHFRAPERGEVVVFRFPNDPSKFFIKRVIGLPGESVVIKDDRISIVDGLKVITLNESYIDHSDPYRPIKVDLAEEEYFVMGDNRDVSSDSRVWGPLSEDLIKGRVLLRLLPVNKITFLPGLDTNLINSD